MAIRNRRDDVHQDHTIDVDAAMQGSLIFKEPVNLRINGKFEGTLEVKGILSIGKTAFVNAHIKGEEIKVSGRIKGDIDAEKILELLESAIVEGNIRTPRLVIANGAVLQGNCLMIGDMLNSEDLAKHLELDEDTVIGWADSGKIPGFKEGNEWKFDKKKIDDWVASGKIG